MNPTIETRFRSLIDKGPFIKQTQLKITNQIRYECEYTFRLRKNYKMHIVYKDGKYHTHHKTQENTIFK